MTGMGGIRAVRVGLAVLAAIASGCAGAPNRATSPAPGMTTESTVSASGSDSTQRSYTTSGTAVRSEGAPRSMPVTTTASSTRAPTSVSVPLGGAASGISSDRLTYWLERLDQAMSTMSSSGECREICRANGGICTAAHEICALTGDGEATTPTDGRCSRARTACEQATRQRNGACSVCPAE